MFKALNIRRRTMTKASMEESQMEDEGKERDESRRIATKFYWKRTRVTRERWQ